MLSDRDIQNLQEELRAARVFVPNHFLSWFKFGLHVVVGGSLIYATVIAPLWAKFLLLPAAAVIWAIGVMMGHEGTHRAAFASNFQNDLLRNLAFPLMSGMSGLYWKYKHNGLHHGFPNVIGRDEDIELWPMAIGRAYHNTSHPVWRWFQKRLQGYLFWPLSSLVAMDLRIRSVRYIMSYAAQRGLDLPMRLDIAMMLLHATCWLVIPSLMFGLGSALLFYIAFWAVASVYLSVLGMTGHAGLPLIDSYDGKWELQFVTTRNIRLNPLLSWCFVGLDYQIEHHLYPRVSHFNLPKAAPLVRRFAQKHHLPYREDRLLPCLLEITLYMKKAWNDRNFLFQHGEMTEVPPRPNPPVPLGKMRDMSGDGRKLARTQPSVIPAAGPDPSTRTDE